jgi:peptidylglycine monooxygenase
MIDVLVGFEPNATMDVAHHMLLYGCTSPGSSEEVWNCGEMAAARSPGLKSASPCAKGSQVIYAWARDAPALDLPEGVAFKVGGGTQVQYLVLQVHYADVTSFVEGQLTGRAPYKHISRICFITSQMNFLSSRWENG